MPNKPYKKILCETKNDFDEYFSRWGKKYSRINSIFKWFCEYFNLYPFTQSKFQGRLKTISSIFDVNNNKTFDEIKELIKEYYNPKTTVFRRLDISKGPQGGLIFQNKLKEKAKTKIHIGKVEYWMKDGTTYKQALKLKEQYYKKLCQKGYNAQQEYYKTNPHAKKEHYKKISQTKKERKKIQYWIAKGYNLKEATEQIKKYQPPINTLNDCIYRHGIKKGSEIYFNIKKKRKQTNILRYGTTTSLQPYVSKTSIKYFIPLYKLLRKRGIKKEDIVWGIGNKKEFTTHDKTTNRNYCFDFVIKSKKIIVEYNDTFWHARNKQDWKNPMVKYEQSYERDENKKQVAKRLGFNILYVWSDDLPCQTTLCEQIFK
jgi:very-short-patch-repair endonuclease